VVLAVFVLFVVSIPLHHIAAGFIAEGEAGDIVGLFDNRHDIGTNVVIPGIDNSAVEFQSVGYDDLMRVFDRQNIVVEPGDILCVRTGFSEALWDMNKKIDPVRLKQIGLYLDGADRALQQFVIDSGLVAICADNRSVEGDPDDSAGGETFELESGYTLMPLHHLCLFKLGVHLAELWYFRELAHWLEAHGRNRFFLTAPPLRLPGAVGSPVTPVATV
jgi:kynurenine formamidase